MIPVPYLAGFLVIVVCVTVVSWSRFLVKALNGVCGDIGRRRKRLPGPISLPFIGSAIQVSFLAHNKKNFELAEILCKTYKSPVLGFYAGLQYFVLVEDYKTAKEMLNSDEWNGRVPAHPMYYDYSQKKNLGVLPGHGELQKESRRFVIRSLVEFGFGEMRTMDYCLQYELDEFLTKFETDRLGSVNHVMSMEKRFNFSALNLLWKVMCGTRFSSDDTEMETLVQFLKETSSLVSVGTQPLYGFPFLRFIPGLTHHQQVCEAYAKGQSIFKKIVEERLRTQSYKSKEPEDFIDKFLLQIDATKEDPSDVFSYENLIQCCVDLLNTGVDTTPNTLEFAMLYMVRYPEVQAKVQEEIDRVIGRNKRPSTTDRFRMPYTEAVLLEVLRLRPVLPIIPRSAVNGATLQGCQIPKNAFAGINVLRINKDPRIWANPEEFDPTRFLDTQTGVLINEKKLLTFGGGRRTCLGYSMAKVALFTFFTSLLQKYTFHMSPDFPNPSLECILSGITIGPQPYKCLVRLRD